jgi:hypothetical protein
MAELQPQPWMLAYEPEVGSIFRCHECRNIHLTLGPASIQVTPQTFLSVVDLFERSASAFAALTEAERNHEASQ